MNEGPLVDCCDVHHVDTIRNGESFQVGAFDEAPSVKSFQMVVRTACQNNVEGQMTHIHEASRVTGLEI